MENEPAKPLPEGFSSVTPDISQDDPAIPMPVKYSHQKRTVLVFVLGIVAIVAGILGGYFVATNTALAEKTTAAVTNASRAIDQKTGVVQQPQPTNLSPQDIRDTATGTIQLKPSNQMDKQGSHILKRDDAPWPIYLTSSTINLSQYEGKHVKIYGVTFDGGTKDWYMEVNKVDQL